MLQTVPPRHWRSSTLRRTLLPTSRKSLTRSTTPHGTALLAETLAATSPTKPSTSSTFTWDRLPSCCSSLVKLECSSYPHSVIYKTVMRFSDLSQNNSDHRVM